MRRQWFSWGREDRAHISDAPGAWKRRRTGLFPHRGPPHLSLTHLAKPAPHSRLGSCPKSEPAAFPGMFSAPGAQHSAPPGLRSDGLMTDPVRRIRPLTHTHTSHRRAGARPRVSLRWRSKGHVGSCHQKITCQGPEPQGDRQGLHLDLATHRDTQNVPHGIYPTLRASRPPQSQGEGLSGACRGPAHRSRL